MLTSLLKCRACRLSWFPRGETAAGCPACGGTKLGGTLEPFHIGMALILLALAGWAAPLVLGDRAALTLPAILQSRPAVAEAERAPPRAGEVQVPPAKGHTVTLRRGDKVRILDRNDRRYLVSDRRGNQLYVTLDKLTLQGSAHKGRRYVQR